MPRTSDSESSSDGNTTADKIHQAVLARKAKQKMAKTQPWLGAYVPNSDDIPTTTSPHDKPWLKYSPNDGGEESPNDTDAGKT